MRSQQAGGESHRAADAFDDGCGHDAFCNAKTSSFDCRGHPAKDDFIACLFISNKFLCTSITMPTLGGGPEVWLCNRAL